MITEKDRLLDGIEHEGRSHFDFEIHLPTMRDTGAALDETEKELGTIEGYEATNFYRAAVIAFSLVSLGTIPTEEITPALIANQLTEDDNDVIQAAIARIKGKRNGGSPGSPVSD